jgi:hypothetical protein
MMPWDANSRCSPVATEDLAQVIVAILENPVTHSGKTYPLCGPAETKKPPRLETPAASLRANRRESAHNRVAAFAVRIFGGGDSQLHLLSYGAGQKAADRMRLPTRGFDGVTSKNWIPLACRHLQGV